jgi:hypothetical protein
VIVLFLLALWAVANAGVDQFSALAGQKIWTVIATNQSLAAGASYNADVEVDSATWLVVQADMNGAVAGDMAVTVTPYEADNVTLSGVTLTAVTTTGPTFAGGKNTYYGKFDVTGLRRVRASVKNNNAGTQTLNRFSAVQQGY